MTRAVRIFFTDSIATALAFWALWLFHGASWRTFWAAVLLIGVVNFQIQFRRPL